MKRASQHLALTLVILGAGALSGAAETPAPGGRPAAPTHLLNLALLVTGNRAADTGEALPPPVAKAVADIKDFLPFKNYRMVDSALVRTASDEPTTVELQGPDLSRYRAFIRYQSAGSGRLNVVKFEVIRIADDSGRDPGTPAPPRAEAPRGQAPEAPMASREVITTSFGIDVGETIVVGTSRLRGEDRALIVVLTALPGK